MALKKYRQQWALFEFSDNAHARRRFEKCLAVMKKEFTKEQLKETTAYQAMTRIGMFYKIEELTADKTRKKDMISNGSS